MKDKLNKMVDLMSRQDKINFLLKSKVMNINFLTEVTSSELNDLTIAGLRATGFKFKNEV